MPKKVEISHRTIIFTAMFVLFLWFIFQIRDVLLIVFVSLILMSALNPAVDQLEKWRSSPLGHFTDLSGFMGNHWWPYRRDSSLIG